MSLPKALQVILNFLIDAVPDKNLPQADAIFVFGHVDKRVALQAIKLFEDKKAPKIIISGGIGVAQRDPGGFPSEAQYFASIMRESGIVQEKLILEEKATHTLENVVLGMREAHDANFYPESLILVALPPLSKRSRATFEKQFPNIKTYGSAFALDKDEWKDERCIRRLLGEIDRLKEYAKKEDIAHVDIPEYVINAYNNISHQFL